MYAMYLRKSRTEDKDIPLEKILKNHYNMLMELADKLNIQVTLAQPLCIACF